MAIQPQKFNKLYYNKWPYRIACFQRGSSRIIRTSKNDVDLWCKGDNSNVGSLWTEIYHYNQSMPFEKKLSIYKNDLLAFSNAVGPYLNSPDIQIRAEGAHFNLYCKDREILESISLSLKEWITRIDGPVTQEEYDYLMQGGRKKILCNQLPKNGTFQYKVYLKSKWSKEERVKFYNWATNSGRVSFPKSTENWMVPVLHSHIWHRNPYIYVKDEKSLTMVGMFIGSNVRKIEEFVPRNTITVG